MKKGKLKYILTWVALLMAVVGGTLLMVAAWNTRLEKSPSGLLMILLWTGIVAASVYLFFFAVILTQEYYRKSVNGSVVPEEPASFQKSGREEPGLHPESTVRKVLRGLPGIGQEKEMGTFLLRNLSQELEIMSGIVYFRKGDDQFVGEAYFAVPPSGNPIVFTEGEGINGQVAKNGQVTILPGVPESYIEVRSGLGSSRNAYLALIPVIKGEHTFLLIECAGFKHDLKDLERIFQLLSRGLSEMIEKLNT